MRCKQSIAKMLSIVMMIVLTQKIAGGLYLHNWLHESKQLSLLPDNTHTISQAACSCIDDFYAPLAGAAMIAANAPSPEPVDFYAVQENALTVITKHFHCLRAPPVSSFF